MTDDQCLEMARLTVIAFWKGAFEKDRSNTTAGVNLMRAQTATVEELLLDIEQLEDILHRAGEQIKRKNSPR